LIDRDTYKGEYFNDEFEGDGIYTTFWNQAYYMGSWLSGKKHGNGQEVRVNGDKYEGSFFKGVRHGFGIMHYNSGATLKYAGEWKEDTKHGDGKEYYKNDAMYTGTFANNLKDGFGKLEKIIV
jgi:hypothetical protein